MSSATTAKLQFSSPADLHDGDKELKTALHPSAVVAPTAVLGTWLNCDHATRGVVRVMITAAGTGINIQAFGACSPTPCDWGVTQGIVYADNVTASSAVAFHATYKFPFKETIVSGRLDGAMLLLETFDRFTDNSGRSSYYSRYYMAK